MHLILIIVCLLISKSSWSNSQSSNAPSYCDKSILVQDTVAHEFALVQDPDHFQKRSFTQTEFCAVLTKINTLYKNLVKKEKNHALKLYGYWDRGLPFAEEKYSERDGTYGVHVNGGYLSLNGFSKDALALVACHEIGHILGGNSRIRKSLSLNDYGQNTSEAFADYFATHQCTKFYFASLNEEYEVPTGTPSRVISSCRNAFQETVKFKLCVRSANAGLSVVSILKPDAHVSYNVESSITSHYTLLRQLEYPEPQCRLDTYLAGAGCPRNGICGLWIDDFKFSNLPRCWFFPGDIRSL